MHLKLMLFRLQKTVLIFKEKIDSLGGDERGNEEDQIQP